MENNKDLDQKLLRTMFNSIRSTEIKNIKTQKVDDKGMIKAIVKHVFEMVSKEMNDDEN